MRLESIRFTRTIFLASVCAILLSPGLYAAGGAARNAAQPSHVPIAKANLQNENDLSQTQMGDLMMVRKRYRDAIDYYNEAADNRLPEIYARTGLAYQRLKDLDRAEQYYRQALGWNPDSLEVTNNLGTLRYDRQDYRQAEKYFREALKRSSESPEIYGNLGAALFEQGKYSKAIDAYATALRHSPSILEKPDTSDWELVRRRPADSAELDFCFSKAYRAAGMADRADAYRAKAREAGFEGDELKDQSGGFSDWLRGIFH